MTVESKVGHGQAATIRVGVVGYGYWGPKHVRVLRSMPGVSVIVADVDANRRRDAQQAFPDVEVRPHLDSLLDDVDAVVVAAPVSLHHALAASSLNEGKHVLVEKPLALTATHCHHLIDLADAQGVCLMVGHTFEHNAGIWKLRELIQSGTLGELCYIDTARLNLGLYQNDINVIWDLAPHDISIVNYLLGRVPDVVSAWGRANTPNAHEDVAYLCLTYTEPELSAYIRVSWLDPCKVRRVTVVGRKKMVVCNDISATERVRIYDASVNHGADEAPEGIPLTYHYGDIVTPFVPFEEPLLVQNSNFIHCIRTGERPRSDGRSGLEVVRVLEAASESLRLQRPVRLSATSSLERI